MCFRPLEVVQKSAILQMTLCTNLKHAYIFFFFNFHTGEKKTPLSFNTLYFPLLSLKSWHWGSIFFVFYRASKTSEETPTVCNLQALKKKGKKRWKVCDIVQTNKMTLSRLKEQQLWNRRDSSSGSHFDRLDACWQRGLNRRPPADSLPGYSTTLLTPIRWRGNS